MDELQKKIANKRIDKWVAPITYIGGFDISYASGNKKDVISFVVIDMSLNIVYEKTVIYDDITDGKREAYKSGYLAFRELPCFRKIWNLMLRDSKFIKPDVVIIDGNGILHHRKCGSAVHIGVEFGISTIGIGKNLLFIDGLDKKIIRNEMDKSGIDEYELIGMSGFKYGYAWRNKGVTNPIYVSAGHMIDNKRSLDIVKMCSIYREPEPVRLADRISRKFLRIFL